MSSRDRALADFRKVHLAPLEKVLQPTARSVADLMPKVFKKLRFDDRRAEAEIVRVWNHLLAPDVVAHAQPVSLCKGTLFVSVDSSVWLAELVRYRYQEILERLRHSFGPVLIRKISFRVQ